MDASIPIPRVPGPPISAPPAARDWNSLVPPKLPPGSAEPFFAQVFDRAGDILPAPLEHAFWGVVKRINRVVLRSTPPNPPVPEQPGSWKFSAIGDYGGGGAPQPQIATNVASGNPDLIVTLGDNVYYRGLESEWAKKWDPPELFGNLRRDFPVRPSLGNHDLRREPGGAPYFRRFPELGGARFYSYEHKGVHFVAVNSNESLEPGSPQYRWLDQDLAASTADWNVLYFHHPLNAGGPGDKGLTKGHLGPLLARHGVDLVLTGHEHSYQRSVPLNPGGTVEVIAGGGGKTLHPFRIRQPAHNAYRDVDFGHVEVEVTGDALVGRYVVQDGSVRDTWTIPNMTPYRPGFGAAAQVASAAGEVAARALTHQGSTPATVLPTGAADPVVGRGAVAAAVEEGHVGGARSRT